MGYIQYFCTYQRDGSSGGFQCVDTLVFVLKHAEGMSLRCDAPSPIVAGMNHRILSMLTRIQRNSTRRLFVEICGGLWAEKISATKCSFDSWNLWFFGQATN